MKYLLYIGNKLSEHGYTPTSIETLGSLLKEDYEVVQVSNRKNWFFRIIHMWWSVIWANKNTVILIDTYSTSAFHFAWSCGVLALIKKLKYIPILRGGGLPDRMDNSPLLSEFFFKNAAFIVSPSSYLKNEVEKRFAVHVNVIPNYIHLKKYPYKSKSFSTIRLLWVRSFHKTYNPLMAVRVLRALHDLGYDKARLCMIGPDKDASRIEVEKLAQKLGVNHVLELTGKLSKKDWIEKSKESNIFINTTNFDNTPVSVMEAMALGFPVITTKVGGIPYLFEDMKEGIMVPQGDTKAMTNAILDLMKAPKQARKISVAAREKAVSWDWKIVKDMWKQLFNELFI